MGTQSTHVDVLPEATGQWGTDRTLSSTCACWRQSASILESSLIWVGDVLSCITYWTILNPTKHLSIWKALIPPHMPSWIKQHTPSSEGNLLSFRNYFVKFAYEINWNLNLLFSQVLCWRKVLCEKMSLFLITKQKFKPSECNGKTQQFVLSGFSWDFNTNICP